MSIHKICPTMKFKESDPSIKIGTIFIKFNRYTCFDVSNQSSGKHFLEEAMKVRKERKKMGGSSTSSGGWPAEETGGREE